MKNSLKAFPPFAIIEIVKEGWNSIMTIEHSPLRKLDPQVAHMVFTILGFMWSAIFAIAIMDRDGLDEPPCTVTASYTVNLRRPTPSDSKLVIRARAVDKSKWDDRIKIEMTLEADGILCAEGKGLFVAVKEGHPAFHRWS